MSIKIEVPQMACIHCRSLFTNEEIIKQFVSDLIGRTPTDEELEQATNKAEEKGIDISDSNNLCSDCLESLDDDIEDI